MNRQFFLVFLSVILSGCATAGPSLGELTASDGTKFYIPKSGVGDEGGPMMTGIVVRDKNGQLRHDISQFSSGTSTQQDVLGNSIPALINAAGNVGSAAAFGISLDAPQTNISEKTNISQKGGGATGGKAVSESEVGDVAGGEAKVGNITTTAKTGPVIVDASKKTHLGPGARLNSPTTATTKIHVGDNRGGVVQGMSQAGNGNHGNQNAVLFGTKKY